MNRDRAVHPAWQGHALYSNSNHVPFNSRATADVRFRLSHAEMLVAVFHLTDVWSNGRIFLSAPSSLLRLPALARGSILLS